MLKQYKLRNYHFQLVISILVLNIIGILIIGSAKHSVQKMQILGCIIGMVAMVIVSLMDYSFILRFTWLYYIGIIVLLGLVMTGIGDSAGGAQRWIDFIGLCSFWGYEYQRSRAMDPFAFDRSYFSAFRAGKNRADFIFRTLFFQTCREPEHGKNHRSFFCPDRNSPAFDCKAAGYFNFHRNCINFY